LHVGGARLRVANCLLRLVQSLLDPGALFALRLQSCTSLFHISLERVTELPQPIHAPLQLVDRGAEFCILFFRLFRGGGVLVLSLRKSHCALLQDGGELCLLLLQALHARLGLFHLCLVSVELLFDGPSALLPLRGSPLQLSKGVFKLALFFLQRSELLVHASRSRSCRLAQ